MTNNRAMHRRAAQGVRYSTVTPGQLRVEGDGESAKIIGHAAVFDVETEIFPGYNEVVRRGAFLKTARESDVRGLFNHDPNFILGRNRAGTLRLSEDEVGLRYEIDPPQTGTIRDLVLSPMSRGELSGSSFAFRAIKAPETVKDDGETVLRELNEVELFDVSPVTYPAYDETDAQLRAWAMSQRHVKLRGALVEILRGGGLTDLEIRETLVGEVAQVTSAEAPPDGRHAAELERLSRSLDLDELTTGCGLS